HHLIDDPPPAWITKVLKPGQILAYDPWLHTVGDVDRLRAAAELAGGSLKPLDGNAVDAIWRDQPPPPLAPVVPHDGRFAGASAEAKRRKVAEGLARERIDAAVVTSPDSIAWLLNIRGGDVLHTPLPLSFAVIGAEGTVELFIDRRKLTPAVHPH